MTEAQILIHKLAGAHTGTDLETDCWEAADLLQWLVYFTKRVNSIIEAAENSDYYDGVNTDELIILTQLQEVASQYKETLKKVIPQ